MRRAGVVSQLARQVQTLSATVTRIQTESAAVNAVALQGAQGEKGPTGQGFRIFTTANTLSTLSSGGSSNAGEFGLVKGGDLYVWMGSNLGTTGSNNAWDYVGDVTDEAMIRGTTGATGSAGANGVTGPAGPIGGSNTQVLFNQSSTANGTSNFVYDYTNSRLGLNTSAPQTALDIRGTLSSLSGRFQAANVSQLGILELGGGSSSTGGGGMPALAFQGDASTVGANGGYRHFVRSRHNNNTTGNAIDFFLNTAGTFSGSTAPNSGNTVGASITATGLGVLTSNPQTALDVVGTISATNLSIAQTISSLSVYTTNLIVTGTLSAPSSGGGGPVAFTRAGSNLDVFASAGGAATTYVDGSGNTWAVHAFTTPGTYTFSTNLTISGAQTLILGGGGGGGNRTDGAGGGGAGGLALSSNVTLTASAYSIVVGSGGGVASSGQNSTFNNVIGYGGGAGATPAFLTPGATGGCGGGGAGDPTTSGGPALQGFKGGNGTNQNVAGGGGGGMGGAGGGSDGGAGRNASIGGYNGGPGLQSSITGNAVIYAGGGGGGGTNAAGGLGGSGGGGNGGQNSVGTPGSNGLGGGGGGAAPGGGGAVILAYPLAQFGTRTVQFGTISVDTTNNLAITPAYSLRVNGPTEYRRVVSNVSAATLSLTSNTYSTLYTIAGPGLTRVALPSIPNQDGGAFWDLTNTTLSTLSFSISGTTDLSTPVSMTPGTTYRALWTGSKYVSTTTAGPVGGTGATGGPGPAGLGTITWGGLANLSLVDAYTIRKTGASDYNGHAYSTQGLKGGFIAAWKSLTAPVSGYKWIGGVTTNTGDNWYGALTLGFFATDTGATQIWINGGAAANITGLYTGNAGTWTVNTIFSLTYDGSMVRWFMNGTLVYYYAYTSTVNHSFVVYPGNIGSGITNAYFSVYTGGTAGATGPTGAGGTGATGPAGVNSGEFPVLTGLSNVSLVGGTIAKTGGTNGAQDAGLYSAFTCVDPELVFTVPTATTSAVVGLNYSQDYSGFPHTGFQINSNGTVSAFEEAPYSGYEIGNYSAGSQFKLRITSSGIEYYINGQLRRTAPLWYGLAQNFYFTAAIRGTTSSITLQGFTPSKLGSPGAAGATGPTGAGATGPTGPTGAGGTGPTGPAGANSGDFPSLGGIANVSFVGPTLTKTGGSAGVQDAGAYTLTRLVSPEITFIPENLADMTIAFHHDQDYTVLPAYGFCVYSGGSLLAFEYSPYSGVGLGSYNAGDTLKLRMTDTAMEYVVNGEVRRAAPLYDGPNASYFGTIALQSMGARVKVAGFISSTLRRGLRGATGATGAAGAPANFNVSEQSGTSLTLSLGNSNTAFYLKNSAFNALTLPASTATSNGGVFWTLRNATSSHMSITLTNTLNLTSPFVIPPSNTQTFVVSSLSSNAILLF